MIQESIFPDERNVGFFSVVEEVSRHRLKEVPLIINRQQ